MRKNQICKPLVDDRATELRRKLESLNAREIADSQGPNGSTLEWYRLNGQVVIVQWYATEYGGYEVYGPIFNGNEVKGTFDALDEIATARYRSLDSYDSLSRRHPNTGRSSTGS